MTTEQEIRAALWPLLGLNPAVDTLGAAMKRINELRASLGASDAPQPVLYVQRASGVYVEADESAIRAWAEPGTRGLRRYNCDCLNADPTTGEPSDADEALYVQRWVYLERDVNALIERERAVGASDAPRRLPTNQELWILEYQILPNLYGLKFAALRRVIDKLRAVGALPVEESQQIHESRSPDGDGHQVSETYVKGEVAEERADVPGVLATRVAAVETFGSRQAGAPRDGNDDRCRNDVKSGDARSDQHLTARELLAARELQGGRAQSGNHSDGVRDLAQVAGSIPADSHSISAASPERREKKTGHRTRQSFKDECYDPTGQQCCCPYCCDYCWDDYKGLTARAASGGTISAAGISGAAAPLDLAPIEARLKERTIGYHWQLDAYQDTAALLAEVHRLRGGQ